MSEGSGDTEHRPEPLDVGCGERLSCPLGKHMCQQEDLQAQPVVRGRGLEARAVAMHLAQDLALELLVGEAEPTRSCGIAFDRSAEGKQPEQIREVVVAPQVRTGLEVRHDVATVRLQAANHLGTERVPERSKGLQRA